MNLVQSIPIEKLAAHPDNPNRMSEANFGKLVRNIEKSGRYEPLIVRPGPQEEGVFQIINGEHRYRALTKLGHKTADCIVWDVDDEQADILLSTLNRLTGTDELGKKLKLLKRLMSKTAAKEIARFLPQSAKQIERLVNLQRPTGPAKIDISGFASPLVFFVDDRQKEIIGEAISQAYERGMDSCFRRNDIVKNENDIIKRGNDKETRARGRAAALVRIAEHFIKTSKSDSGI